VVSIVRTSDLSSSRGRQLSDPAERPSRPWLVTRLLLSSLWLPGSTASETSPLLTPPSLDELLSLFSVHLILCCVVHVAAGKLCRSSLTIPDPFCTGIVGNRPGDRPGGRPRFHALRVVTNKTCVIVRCRRPESNFIRADRHDQPTNNNEHNETICPRCGANLTVATIAHGHG
jgi:hypothetical protein